MNHFELLTKYSNDKKIIEHFIQVRYGNHITCHYCNSTKIARFKNRPKFFQCNGCNKTFSIFKGTIFEKTRVSLVKWMLAINFVCNNKKSLPALQFQREIGGSYKTSFRMLHQIRKAMDSSKDTKDLFEMIVEVDETYVGGKPRKGAKKELDAKVKRGRGTKKIPVIGVLERGTGRVHARVALPNNKGQKLTGKQLLNVINEAVGKNATIMTDEFKGYKLLDKMNTADRIHLVVDHSKEYANGWIHTNGIEGFWSLLKRGIIGSYHKVSVKYVSAYLTPPHRIKKELFTIL